MTESCSLPSVSSDRTEPPEADSFLSVWDPQTAMGTRIARSSVLEIQSPGLSLGAPDLAGPGETPESALWQPHPVILSWETLQTLL